MTSGSRPHDDCTPGNCKDTRTGSGGTDGGGAAARSGIGSGRARNHRIEHDINDPTGLARTLGFLKSHSSEYLSGRDLGDVLGISRVAVWKHIRALKGLGYGIESRQKVGYRLRVGCDEPYPWEVADGLDTKTVGSKIIYFDTIGSTQDAAAGLEPRPANDGAVVIAATQTGARGRADKKWSSPRGGIWMSVALYPACGASAASLLPLGAGVAVAEAIKDVCGISPELRWPNDITIRDRKVAGIITESELELDVMQKACIGIGINYQVDAGAIEVEFASSPGFYGATSISSECGPPEAGGPAPRKTALVRSVLARLDLAYHEILSGNTSRITSEWAERSSTIGRRVSTPAGAGGTRVTGIAEGIADNGMLVIKPDGTRPKARHDGTEPTIRIAAGSLAYL